LSPPRNSFLSEELRFILASPARLRAVGRLGVTHIIPSEERLRGTGAPAPRNASEEL
jgi:hypothetical protein